MQLSIVIVLLFLLAGIAYWRLISRHQRRLNSGQPLLRRIDLPAFRNLLREDDDLFLKQVLPGHSYRQVKRARTRATQEYVSWIAQNALTIQVLVRPASPDKIAVSQALHTLVRSAMRMRLLALAEWIWLWLQWTLPQVDLRPRDLAESYGDLLKQATQLSFEASAHFQIEMKS